MREIKYQAWDTRDKRMIEWQELLDYGSGLAEYLQNPRELIFREYTGLKDKNGKEIYEGDIVIFVPGYSFAIEDKDTFIGYVKWIDDNAGFFVVHNYYDDIKDLDVVDKVIGNIYENPELKEVE